MQPVTIDIYNMEIAPFLVSAANKYHTDECGEITREQCRN